MYSKYTVVSIMVPNVSRLKVLFPDTPDFYERIFVKTDNEVWEMVGNECEYYNNDKELWDIYLQATVVKQ